MCPLQQEEQMRSMRLGQSVGVALTTSLVLLIVGVVLLALAIRPGVLVPPPLDMRYNTIRVVAYSTHYPECLPFTQCPPQSVGPPQEYYVIWIINELVKTAQPYGRNGDRILAVPLRH